MKKMNGNYERHEFFGCSMGIKHLKDMQRPDRLWRGANLQLKSGRKIMKIQLSFFRGGGIIICSKKVN